MVLVLYAHLDLQYSCISQRWILKVFTFPKGRLLLQAETRARKGENTSGPDPTERKRPGGRSTSTFFNGRLGSQLVLTLTPSNTTVLLPLFVNTLYIQKNPNSRSDCGPWLIKKKYSLASGSTRNQLFDQLSQEGFQAVRVWSQQASGMPVMIKQTTLSFVAQDLLQDVEIWNHRVERLDWKDSVISHSDLRDKRNGILYPRVSWRSLRPPFLARP